MIISKTADDFNNFKNSEFYYKSAREGLYDLVSNIKQSESIKTIFLPSYVGLSPKEGSGIFDAISKVGAHITYYKMKDDLSIDFEDLYRRINNIGCINYVVLIVNYFGFRDKNYTSILKSVKDLGGWVIEDNAHGFYTYYNDNRSLADATFFSLHKMFPFGYGGSLLLLNNKLKNLNYTGDRTVYPDCNPWQYDINRISEIRRCNYIKLLNIVDKQKYSKFFKPLKRDLESNIPQSFPITILCGDRNKIYEIMNKEGYGVVSLYHTLIDELNNQEYINSVNLSKCIMNLPIHQDVNINYYEDMIDELVEACKFTAIN